MTIVNPLPADEIHLHAGSHDPNQEQKWCAMEAVAYMAGEEWTDHPRCACPVIAAFIRKWNDDLEDRDRDRLLVPLLTRLIGSRSIREVQTRRAWMASDWLVGENAAAWLDLAGIDHGLRALPPLTADTVAVAMPALTEARQRAAAARAAAGAAARDAAWDAAGYAAGAAAGYAARAAAGAAAGAAAWDAAWDAARAAAGDATGAAARAALRPTVETLQQSALGLLDRMLLVEAAG
ncbi:MAG: hypothetical protein ACKVWR_21790 [Acidimicrobiales bacterium]